MMRLIDADELLKHKTDHDTISTHLIYNAPTVDAVPVIRCKDCKKFVVEEEQAYCLDMFGQCDENGFCSWAERKDNEID